MRRGASLAVAVGLMVSLAACSAPATDGAAKECAPAKSGKASDGVTVDGKFGTKPKVTIASPVSVKSTERTVAIKGDGKVAEKGYDVTVEYSVFNATSGAEIDATTYDGKTSPVVPLDGTLIAGLTKTLQCSTVGSRVVGVIPPKDGFGEAGSEATGVAGTDSLVFVADVVAAEKPAKVTPPLPKSDGADQPLPEGFPAITVKIADDKVGTPTVTVPDGEAPAELQVAVLKKGEGAVIAENSDVVVNYQGQIWASKTIFDQSFDKQPATFNTGQVVPGFKKALEGQTVGSEILVTMPPVDGYGEACNSQAGIAGTDTLVFLIDILGVG